MEKYDSKKGLSQFMEDFLYDILLKNHSAAANLRKMFSDDMQAASKYLKVGRQFWKYNDNTEEFDLITVTYIRSGIVFYVKEGEEEEQSFGTKSLAAGLLYPRIIYLQDIAEFIKENHKDFNPEGLVTMYKRMPLDIPRDYMKIDIDYNIKLCENPS